MAEPSRRHLAPDLVTPRHEAITHSLFAGIPVFFDPRDLLQVRYELLRCHRVDGETVVRVCREFGVSRQTFYNLLEKFEAEGLPGLLPRRPGPKGPTKVTDEVIDLARHELSGQPNISGAALAARVRAELGLEVHKRTIERLLRDLRSKKNV
ncbi:MAG: helix-turn-helix domain-containing protein [Planctomycetota bacterium]|jgi:transposase